MPRYKGGPKPTVANEKKPPEKKEPPDQMLVGYQFQYDKEKTPYDFLDDPEREGFRLGETVRKASGAVKTLLDNGIEHATLPPLAIWKLGMWYDELPFEAKQLIQYVNKTEERLAYVTPGEGTPGNYLLRVYVLPKALEQEKNPKHPMMWAKGLKEHKPWTMKKNSGWLDDDRDYNHGYGFHQPTPTKAAAKPAAAPALPAGIRFRCPGCGHWWKESTLAQHSNFCCPGREADEGDWAIMCECCATLDQVSTVKPGFPRKPKITEPKEEVKPDEESKEETAVVVAAD